MNLIKEGTDCLYFGTLAQRNDISKGTLNSLFGKKLKYFCDLNLRQNFYTADIIRTSLNSAHILKLNNDELKIINELLLKQDYGEASLAKLLSEKFNIELVCITLGEKGAILYKNGIVDHYKVDITKIVDTVGAGDAYASVLCFGYLNEWNISKINRIASEFAASVVQIKGALPKNEDIYKILKEKIIIE